MRHLLVLLLFLAMLLPMFALAQTSTFTTGTAYCSRTFTVTGSTLNCFGVPFVDSNNNLAGYLTFSLQTNTSSQITSGELWRYNSADVQTGYATEITGMWTSNTSFNFAFSDGAAFNGSSAQSIKFVTSCGRYGCPTRIYTSGGRVTFQ